MDISPARQVLPHLQRSHGENSPQLRGFPSLADRATRFSGDYPTSHVNKIKKNRERLGTPPTARQATSPSRGPQPPCEQALILPNSLTKSRTMNTDSPSSLPPFCESESVQCKVEKQRLKCSQIYWKILLLHFQLFCLPHSPVPNYQT